MDYFFLFIASVIIILALSLSMKFKKYQGKSSKVDKNLRTQKDENGKVEFVRCPICNTPLAKDEDLFSRIYRPMNTPDQRMTIHGCPHCYPKMEAGVKRSCPVCGKEVPLDGELIARLFNRTDRKKHVMVTGCTICYGGKS